MKDSGYDRAFADGVGNAVGIMGHGPRQVVLLGHIDTVEGEIPVRVEDDILYGRGSVDAKGPLAAFVDAVARLGMVDGWQWVVIGAVDEERDSVGARYITPRHHPDFAIVGEPNRWERIALGYKGTAWARITVRRSRAHTAGPGESACEAALAAWQAMRNWAEAFNAGRERVFDQVSPTLREMASGDNGFEEWAGLRVGVRLPPDLPPDAWYEEIRKILGSGVSIEPTGFPIPAYQSEKNTPLVRAFLASIRAAGGKPSFVLKSGTADLNIVAPVWSCPAVVYGPGDSALDHTPGECLSLDEYIRAVDVLQNVLKQLSQE
jgi:LysW-gamma-L-lysine carboxypeptidase